MKLNKIKVICLALTLTVYTITYLVCKHFILDTGWAIFTAFWVGNLMAIVDGAIKDYYTRSSKLKFYPYKPI